MFGNKLNLAGFTNLNAPKAELKKANNNDLEKGEKDEISNKMPPELKKVFEEAKKTIQQQLQNRKSDVQKSFEGHDDIHKSHLGYMLGSDNLKVSKKGKEIKEKLEKVLSDEKDQKTTLSTECTSLKEKIGTEPTCDVDDYTFQGLKNRIAVAPKVYEWNECYSNVQISETSPDSDKLINDVCTLKRKYNQCVREFIESSAEIIQIQTMIDNMDEKKSYDLTVKQASVLGF